MAIAPLVAGWQDTGGRWATPNFLLPPTSGNQFQRGVPFLPDEYGPFSRLVVLAAFGADPSLDPSNWVMTDISTYVLQSYGITITPGRLDEQQQSQPTSCQFTVKNSTGNWSPRNTAGVWYPYARTGLPVAVTVDLGTGEQDRFTGYVDSITRDYDVTGNYAVATIHATGSLNRITQQDQPSESPMRRAYLSSGVAAYWSLEDAQGANALTVPSTLPGGHELRVTGVNLITFRGEQGPVGSDLVMDFSSSSTAITTLVGAVDPLAASTAWRVEFSVLYRTTDTSTYQVLLPGWSDTEGTFWYLDANPVANGGIRLHWQTAGGTLNTYNSVYELNDGLWHLWRIDGVKSGSDIGINIWVDNQIVASHLITGLPYGSVNEADLEAALGSTSDKVTALGHFAVWQYTPSLAVGTAIYNAFLGHDGEGCWTRLLRLCAENGIPAAVATGAAGGGRAMGPQGTDTLINLLRECEAADGGVMVDG